MANSHVDTLGTPAAGKAHAREPLPVGISFYDKVVGGSYYYADKTLLVRDVLADAPEVILFCRPRRFGKTLNLDMLRRFFELPVDGGDTAHLFNDKLVAGCGDEVMRHQGRYPAVWLTFKDVKYPSWEGALSSIAQLIQTECARHAYLADSPACSPQDREFFARMLAADPGAAPQALAVLTRMLAAHHGQPCVIFIDEYDTPVNEAIHLGCYDDAVRFMRVFLSGGLKDNPALFHGYLTGILRVAKEGIFSGMNNLAVDTVLSEKYAQYFGFTHDEVRTMCEAYDVPGTYEEICSWYDGYRFGEREMFNPWSVVNYFRDGCKARSYWVSTSSNSVVADVLAQATPDVERDLRKLLLGGSVPAYVRTDAVYPKLLDDKTAAYSLLLMSGYLTVDGEPIDLSSDLWRLRLPNRELASVYRREIIDGLGPVFPPSPASDFNVALLSGDAQEAASCLERLLVESASYFDTASEAFYHGLTLGLVAAVDGRYRVESNREAGEGRFDIALEPANPADGLRGIVIELKAAEKSPVDEEALGRLARAAVEQIKSRDYAATMRSHGVEGVLAYGIAFGGKHACARVERIV